MSLSEQLTGWVAVLALLGATGACVHVPPYARGKLARPDMTTSDMLGPAERHVRAVREGANGGGTVAESGCGCN